MRGKLLAVAVLCAAAVVACVVSFSQDGVKSLLLQSVPVQGSVEAGGQPLHLYYMPEGASLESLPYQQPVAAAHPVRYMYVPGTALVETPYGPRYVRVYQPELTEEAAPQQPTAAAANVPTQRAIISKHAKEINALRTALNKAEMHEAKYEKQTASLAQKSRAAQATAKAAQAQVAKAKQLAQWSKMEKAAALRLANVEKMAEKRVAKQSSVIAKLLPQVRQEVSRRRVLEKRLAQASLSARMSEQQQMWMRQRLQDDIRIAQQARAQARLAKLSYGTMQKRAVKMQQEANEDRKQAHKDILEARASVVGARKSAAKTLAAIRAEMSAKGGLGGVSQLNEQNFARAARQATKEMGSKKRAAKALREDAVRLDSQSRELTMNAAQWQQQIPPAQAKARQTEAEAQQLRAQLKHTVQMGLPYNNQVQSATELTAVSAQSAEGIIHQLAVSEQQHQQAAALLARVSKMAQSETLKAQRDAVLARRRLAFDKKKAAAAMHEAIVDQQKMKSLQAVLADSKTELAELQTEATDIAGSEE